jgi:hypothetical protein
VPQHALHTITVVGVFPKFYTKMILMYQLINANINVLNVLKIVLVCSEKFVDETHSISTYSGI